MKSRNRKLITIVFSILAVGVCCFRALPLLFGSETGFDWSTVIIISSMVIFVQLLNAIKFKVLLKGDGDLASLFGVCLVSNFMGAFLFTQLAGDVSRVWMLNGSRDSDGRHEVAVIRDRLSSLAIVGIMVVWVAGSEFGLFPKSSILLVLLVVLLVMCSSLLENWLTTWTSRLIRIPVLKNNVTLRKIQTFSEHSRLPLRDWFCVHMGSLIVQLVGVLAILFSFYRLGISLDLYEGSLLACVSALVVIFPLTVGGVGIREISMFSMMLHWGIDEATVTAGIAQLTVAFLLGTSIGAIAGRFFLKQFDKKLPAGSHMG